MFRRLHPRDAYGGGTGAAAIARRIASPARVRPPYASRGCRRRNTWKMVVVVGHLHRDAYGGGTGAGLTIARRIAERHGGRLWLERSEPGAGSSFCFTSAPNGSPRSAALAVVEDSDEDLEALSRVLRETTSREGVRRYASGEDALAGLLEGSDTRPALIILDLNLPGIRGMEVLTRSKPTRACGGAGDRPPRLREEDVDAAYAAGANAYLSKPLDYTELRRTVLSMHEFWRIASLPGKFE